MMHGKLRELYRTKIIHLPIYGQAESDIPDGVYCYSSTKEKVEVDHYIDENGKSVSCKPYTMPKRTLCPFWSRNVSQEKQMNGYCSYLRSGDWIEDGTFLLWDQVKECGVKVDRFEELNEF